MKDYPPIGSKIRLLRTLARNTIATKGAVLTVCERSELGLRVRDDIGDWFVLCGAVAVIQYNEGISWERVTE